MMKNLNRLIGTLLLAMITAVVFGQGMTTSGMNGRILDDNGESLIGATVIALHNPTGSQFASISDADGYWRIPNMTVGGPYTITISYVGYEPLLEEGIFLSLGQTFKLDAMMSQTTVALVEVVVVGSRFKYDLFDGNVTGTETVIE
ncbi:carboxypeptidase regulatory-like domain-containing protein, partial [bacterium]|nr:carboxypeptidase regulatory-like domain-containing protein [bacterium]